MNKRCVASICVVALGGLAFGPFVLAGAGDAARAEDAPDLTLALSSLRASILEYEPLILDIRIRNEGATAQEIRPMPTLANSFNVHISGPGGGRRRYYSWGTVTVYGTKRVLNSGETHSARFPIHYGGFPLDKFPGVEGDFVFPRAGTYLVTVEYPPHKGAVDTLKVEVSETAGRDREALGLFRGEKQGRFIESGQGDLPPEFRRLAEEYPDTVYGRFARFYRAAVPLAFRWPEARQEFAAQLAGLDRANAERRLAELAFDKRAREFAELARSEPAFPLADECLLKQAECYLNSPSNRKAEAVKVLEDLVAKYPESPVAVTARKRVEELTAPREPAQPAPAEAKPEQPGLPAKEPAAPESR